MWRGLGVLRQFSTSIGAASSHIKHKTPRKRASGLLEVLKTEELAKLSKEKVIPSFRPGDSVKIERLPYASAPTPDIIKGIVIARYNKGHETRIDVINEISGVSVQWLVRPYDPLVKSISVLKKRYGFRYRRSNKSRAKLFFLLERKSSFYAVK